VRSKDRCVFLYVFILHTKEKYNKIRGPPVGLEERTNRNTGGFFIMKKYEVKLETKQGKKTVKVYIEDNTANLLDNCSEEVKQIYLIEEYKARNKDRAERRRHISYEELIAKGKGIATKENNSLEIIIQREENKKLKEALKSLTDKQYRVVWKYVIERKSYREIGKGMGIRWESVREHYRLGIRKLRKRLLERPSQKAETKAKGREVALKEKTKNKRRRIMKELKEIRKDLKEIRYYYSRKDIFDKAIGGEGVNAVIAKASKYNEIMQIAPPRLYDIYVSLYVRNYTQEGLSVELGYTPEYVQLQHKKLLLYIQERLNA